MVILTRLPPTAIRSRVTSFLSAVPRCTTTLTWPLSPPHRAKSTLTIVKAAADAPRRVSTPIVFITASTFDSHKASKLFATFVQHFSSQGYESMLLDLDPDGIESKRTSKRILKAYAADMKSVLQGASLPPPVLMARRVSCFIAQQYACSHPHSLASLVLLDPPGSTALADELHPHVLPKPFKLEHVDYPFPRRRFYSMNELAILHEHDWDLNQLQSLEEPIPRCVYQNLDVQVPKVMQKWLEEDCDILSQKPSQEGLESEEDSDQLEEDPDVEYEDIVEEQDDQGGSSVSSRSVSRSASNLPAASSAGRFLLADNQLPSWFTTSEVYAFTASKKMPLTLDESHLRETFNRGGGKGGQAINKNKSRCDLLHTPTGVIVRCQEERALARNRVLARRRMSILLEEGLRAAAPPGGAGGARSAELSVKEKAREKERKKKLNKKKKQKKKMSLKAAADEDLENVGEEGENVGEEGEKAGEEESRSKNDATKD